jgi:hypothetical protein
MEVTTSGTLGDAFFIILKLYGKTVTKINHFTAHAGVYPKLKEIFSLLGDVEFNILPSRPQKTIEGFMEDGEVATPFPEFNLPPIDKFGLPTEYSVVQLQSGINISRTPWKQLNQNDIPSIRTDIPTVIIGTDDKVIYFSNENVNIDIRNKTTLFESLSIIRGSQEFYGPQGLLAFFALSQKVKSNVWLRHQSDNHAVNVRINRIPEWSKYINYK